MSVQTLIETLENKVKMIEQSLSQAASQSELWSKNHASLTGMLQATKEALDEALKVVAEPLPE